MSFAGHGVSRNTEALTALTIGRFLDAARRGDCASRERAQGMQLTTK